MRQSKRTSAWHNLMIKTVNTLLEAGVIELPKDGRSNGEMEFTWLGEQFAARAHDIGYGEIQISVEMTSSPKLDKPVATGWVERLTGTYLQESLRPVFRRFPNEVKEKLAGAEVRPLGYAPTGKFYF